MHHLGDLVDRPRPDELNKSEDRGNALLQELQELIENLFHGRASLPCPANGCNERCGKSLRDNVELLTSGRAQIEREVRSFGSKVHARTRPVA
jgi:hypothetical protein